MSERVMDRYLPTSYVSRREFAKSVSTLGLAMMTVPFLQRPARSAETVEFLTWSGYDNPELYGKFFPDHPDGLRFTLLTDEEQALQKILAGFNPDLVHPCIHIMLKYVDAGIVKPIDVSRLTRWNDVIPALRSANGVVVDGNVVMMPFDWGNSSILYRTDLVDIEEESWSLLFDDRYAGKIAMYDADTAVVVAGLALGFDNVWAMTDEQLAECRKMLERQARLVRFFWSDQTTIQQALASGELVAAYAWNDAYKNLKSEGLPVKYMDPKEGILTWVCGPTIVNTGAADEDLVYEVLNAMLSPEAGRYVIEANGYGHSNSQSFSLVSKELLEDLGFGVDPSEKLGRGRIFSPIPGALHTKYIHLFESVKADAGI
jgi:spermidine/putrescine-binding protein